MSKKDNGVDEKMTELESIRDWFMGEDFMLDEAAMRYKKAKELSKEIKEDIDKMENEIEILD
jgi:exodeoxyribonuclease VII small subunit